MPTYSYYCVGCDTHITRLCKIAERDDQICADCKEVLKRGIDRPGSVWAPTAGGMR